MALCEWYPSIPLQRLLRICPKDVDEPIRQHIVAAQWPIVRIIGMSSDQCIAQRWPAAHGYNDGRVAPNALPKLELDEVSGLQLGQFRNLYSYRPWPRRRQSGQKVIEIWNSCPSGGFLVGVNVIPAKGWRVVHDSDPGVKTLRREVGAIAPQIFIVIEGRIAVKGPTVGIGHRPGPVIRDRRRGI